MSYTSDSLDTLGSDVVLIDVRPPQFEGHSFIEALLAFSEAQVPIMLHPDSSIDRQTSIGKGK